MFSFFSAPPLIGIECTDAWMRAVLVRKGRAVAKSKQELPPGAVEHGVIRNAAQCKEVYSIVLAGLASRPSNAQIVLCLPPEAVYHALAELAPGSQASRQKRLQEAMEALIPEPWTDLAVVSRALGNNDVCAAIRRDTLQGYLQLCAGTGMRILRANATSAFLGGVLAGRLRGHAHPLLVRAPTDRREPATVTLFQEGVPAEETLVRDHAKLPGAVAAFIAEERLKGMETDAVFVLGTDALIAEIQKTLAPPEKTAAGKKTKAAPASSPPVSAIPVEQAAPDVSETEQEWFCAAAAGAAGGGVLSFV